MKTTALILGILTLCAFSSCKCDFDEDEPRNRDKENEKVSKNAPSVSESDTLNLK